MRKKCGQTSPFLKLVFRSGKNFFFKYIFGAGVNIWELKINWGQQISGFKHSAECVHNGEVWTIFFNILVYVQKSFYNGQFGSNLKVCGGKGVVITLNWLI